MTNPNTISQLIADLESAEEGSWNNYAKACVLAVEANAAFVQSSPGEDFEKARDAAHDAMRAALKVRARLHQIEETT